MVSDTGNKSERSAMARITRSEHLGQGALVLGVAALACAIVPPTVEVAWVAALPAVILALLAMSIGPGRKRYAALALLFSWFAFSFSFAMMLWG
jgi:hypothetical protein